MDWDSAKSIAAIWGALLSTVLAFGKLMEPRPLISLEAFRTDVTDYRYRIRIENVARYPILVEKISSCGGDSAISRISVSDWEVPDVIAYSRDESLHIFLRPNERATVEFVVEPDPPESLRLKVNWRRHGGFPFPAFPKYFYRSKNDVFAMRRHTKIVTRNSSG